MRSRRESARSALAVGLLAFATANVALAVVVDSARPEWRDPEFGHRLIRLKELKNESPHGPLVLVLGSSRVQQGIDPGAMAFPGGPTDPLVFNFGYRGAGPPIAARNLFRIIGAGVRPDFVLVEFSPASVAGAPGAAPGLSAVSVVRNWANRLTVDDVQWLTESGFLDVRQAAGAGALAKWGGTIAMPWSSHRQVIVSHWLPDWVPELQRELLGRERMDRYGFSEMPVSSTTTELYRANPDLCRERCARSLSRTSITASARSAYSLLIDRCRAEGIPVAVAWVPLAPLLSRWMNPELQRACADYAASLGGQSGVVVFPPPDWVVDDDFADGQHLLPAAAARYSRWLAEERLKPWLARHGR
jgi:hypothetical protein